ncbi:MAG: acyltransferase [Methylocystaceae bacterium]|nr:MAG: acyltransferase [Methylocystaceae bacterium]
MTLSIQDHGLNNTITASSRTLDRMNGTIVFRGSNNKVLIGEDTYSISSNFNIGSDSNIEIGNDCALGGIEIFTETTANIRIGNGCLFIWRTQLLCHEANDISVGHGCIFGSDTLVTVSDMHSIIDIETGKRINPSSHIVIGDKVWIAIGAYVFKGAKIGSGSIIGARSIVTSAIPSNVLAVGAPTKVVKRNVTWKYELVELASTITPTISGVP